MKETTFKLEIRLITPLLGSQPSVNVASEFIAKRAGMEMLPEDEKAMLPEALEKGTTVFHRDGNEHPAMVDYQIKGFLKNSAKVQNGKVKGQVRNLRQKVEDTVFISPRVLTIQFPNGEEDISYCERPLRADTMQGPRVALARSEQVPEGCVIKCGIILLEGQIDEDVLRELLDYGYYNGLGQWRGGGLGRFTYELVREE